MVLFSTASGGPGSFAAIIKTVFIKRNAEFHGYAISLAGILCYYTEQGYRHKHES